MPGLYRCLPAIFLITFGAVTVQSAERSQSICTSGNLVRRVIVEVGDLSTNLPCEVVYWKDTEAPGVRRVLWNARTDTSYCDAKAVGLIDKLANAGWSCGGNDQSAAAVVPPSNAVATPAAPADPANTAVPSVDAATTEPGCSQHQRLHLQHRNPRSSSLLQRRKVMARHSPQQRLNRLPYPRHRSNRRRPKIWRRLQSSPVHLRAPPRSINCKPLFRPIFPASTSRLTVTFRHKSVISAISTMMESTMPWCSSITNQALRISPSSLLLISSMGKATILPRPSLSAAPTLPCGKCWSKRSSTD